MIYFAGKMVKKAYIKNSSLALCGRVISESLRSALNSRRSCWCANLVDKTTASGAILVGLVMIVVGIALYSVTTREPDVVIFGDLYYRIIHPYENPSRVFIIAGICFLVGGALAYPFRLRPRELPYTYSEGHEGSVTTEFCSKCGSQNDKDAAYCKKCGNVLQQK